jgi:hypothetical protein
MPGSSKRFPGLRWRFGSCSSVCRNPHNPPQISEKMGAFLPDASRRFSRGPPRHLHACTCNSRIASSCALVVEARGEAYRRAHEPSAPISRGSGGAGAIHCRNPPSNDVGAYWQRFQRCSDTTSQVPGERQLGRIVRARFARARLAPPVTLVGAFALWSKSPRRVSLVHPNCATF